MDNELEGLQYDKLVLDHNVHKIVGKVLTVRKGVSGESNIDEGAIWLSTGLGYLNKDTPDELIQNSLDDTIIISKSALVEFIKNKK